MLSVSPNCIVRSSLEEMLVALQRRDESEMPRDVPPALPRRAVIRSRPPSFKRRLPVTSCADENEESSEFCVKKGGIRGLNKIVALDDSRQQVLQATPELQKGLDYHQDHQNLHELNRVAVTFQSYVRGEIARKEYGALLRLKKQDTRDRLDHLETLPPVVEELQKRVSEEATLELKEQENASLREQVQQYDANLKSTEETWQKQITSLQVDMAMAAARKSAVAESTTIGRDGSQTPRVEEKNEGFNPIIDGVKVSFEDESKAVVEVKNSHYASPMEKLQRLKRTIKAWIKDQKVRFRDSKTRVHTVGHNEATDRPWKSWWVKKSKRASSM